MEIQEAVNTILKGSVEEQRRFLVAYLSDDPAPSVVKVLAVAIAAVLEGSS